MKMTRFPFCLISFILYTAGLVLFYFRYVPLVPAFQTSILPFLFAVFILTAVDVRKGVLLFTFLFPLINGLPYFFNIYEPFPHAPAALVLFLFFFWGFLAERLIRVVTPSKNMAPSPPLVSGARSILGLMALLSIVMAFSFVITFQRYANFFPFLTDSIYELQTNTYGVTAGGAIMSVVFNTLSYVSGYAFFYILIRVIDSRDYLKKIIVIFCAVTSLSYVFALFQHFINLNLGNNPLSIYVGSINATFKDGLSFGAFVSMAVPLLLGMAMAFPGRLRVFSLALAAVSLYLIFFTASKTAFICLGIGLIAMIPTSWYYLKSRWGLARPMRKRWILAAALGALVIMGGLLLGERPIVKEIRNSKTLTRIEANWNAASLKNILAGREDTLWRAAWLMIKRHPLAGTGIGSYIIESSNYAALGKFDIGTPESAENYLLEIGAELGAIGTALALGIFVTLIWRIAVGRRALSRHDRWRPVFAGGSVSLLGFFVNLQFHTYVQSYEIHYLFWMIAAIVTALSAGITETGDADRRKPEEPRIEREETTGRQRWLLAGKIAVAAILLVFVASQIWDSTHSLSLKNHTKIFSWEQDFGLDKPEKTPDGREFRWSKDVAAITVKFENREAVVPLHASHPDIAEKPVTVKIYLVSGFFRKLTLLSAVKLADPGWKNVTLSLPKVNGEDARLLIKVDRTWNPQKTLGVPDPRNLGVAVGKITTSPHFP